MAVFLDRWAIAEIKFKRRDYPGFYVSLNELIYLNFYCKKMLFL